MAFGVGLYAPFAAKKPLEPVEAVLVFGRSRSDWPARP